MSRNWGRQHLSLHSNYLFVVVSGLPSPLQPSCSTAAATTAAATAAAAATRRSIQHLPIVHLVWGAISGGSTQMVHHHTGVAGVRNLGTAGRNAPMCGRWSSWTKCSGWMKLRPKCYGLKMAWMHLWTPGRVKGGGACCARSMGTVWPAAHCQKRGSLCVQHQRKKPQCCLQHQREKPRCCLQRRRKKIQLRGVGGSAPAVALRVSAVAVTFGGTTPALACTAWGCPSRTAWGCLSRTAWGCLSHTTWGCRACTA
ncbi:UNVERIFIED_CONTAM: hypothetical protein FKN15_049242 [Acipenser sinensis]